MSNFKSLPSLRLFLKGSNHINSKNDDAHAAIDILTTAVTELQTQVEDLKKSVKALERPASSTP